MVPFERGGEAEAWLRADGVSVDHSLGSGRWPSMAEICQAIDAVPNVRHERRTTQAGVVLELIRNDGVSEEHVRLLIESSNSVRFSIETRFTRFAFEVLEMLSRTAGPFLVTHSSVGSGAIIAPGVDLSSIERRVLDNPP